MIVTQNSKINPARIVVCIVLISAIFCVFAGRLFEWQIIEGEQYRKVSNYEASYAVTSEGVRGEILDVNGVGLATNKSVFNVVIDKIYLKKNKENDAIQLLIQIFDEEKKKWNDILPISADGDGNYAFTDGKEDEIERLKSVDILNMNSYSTAEECMNKLIERYELNEGILTPTMKRNIASVRYGMEINGYSMTVQYVFAQDVDKATVAVVSERTQGFSGISVTTSYKRENPNGDVAAHIVGSVGALSADEYERLKDSGYSYNDKIGKGGIESALESYLRGTGGKQLISRSTQGEVTGVSALGTAQPGNTVYLTLDTKLQKIANKSLAENVTSARNAGKANKQKHTGEDCVSGAAVMLSVKDFSVLAAATYPNYDLSKCNDYKYYSKLLNDEETKPLYNRAFNGIFAPGSIFKPCVAAAALQENIIVPSSVINCTHVYDYYPSDTVRCMGYHGKINLFSAVARSCNYYFADVGRRLGIDTMFLYAERFGLGVKTGIEVYEDTGSLAGRDSGYWHEANSVKAAIGQSDNAFTPVQLATYAATIANNGVRLKTHLVRKVVSYDRSKVIYENSPDNASVESETGISQKNINYVKEAMREVVSKSYGTANYMFGDYKVDIAAKTGTAENAGSDHTTFICFAPYDKPEVAIAVVIEHGAKGQYSMSVAKDLLDAYFK